TKLARLTELDVGTVDSLWAPDPDGWVEAVVVNGSSIYAGGFFTRIKGTTEPGIARLGATRGARDDSFATQLEGPGSVSAIARQADGRIIIGGRFDRVGAFWRKNLARFNMDGSVDSGWNPAAEGL